MADNVTMQNRHPVPPTSYGSVPTTPGQVPAPSMWSGGGYGVKNGVPYGTVLRNEQRTLDRQHKFMPAASARMRAATRRALGR